MNNGMKNGILIPILLLSGGVARARIAPAAGPPLQGGAALRPVTWSAAPGGSAHPDLGRALDKPLVNPWRLVDRKTRRTRHVGTCKELLALDPTAEPMDVHDGAPPTPLIESDWNLYVEDLVACRVIVAIQSAKPARVDYLGPFPLDNGRLKEIPAAVVPTPSEDEEEQLAKASARGVSWKKWDRKIHVTRTGHGTVIIESPDIHCLLSVEGRGDFDGDGVEDLVLYRSGGGQEGSWHSTTAFILTRRSPRGRIEIVKVIE